MGHEKSLVFKSSHEHAPDTRGLNGKKQSPRIVGKGCSSLVSFRKQTGHKSHLLCEPVDFNTMVVLVIGCSTDLRHKIIISPKVQINGDFTVRSVPVLPATMNYFCPHTQNNILREFHDPPCFAKWGRKTWAGQKSDAHRETKHTQWCFTLPFSHRLENEDWQQLMTLGNHVWIIHQGKHDLNHSYEIIISKYPT